MLTRLEVTGFKNLLDLTVEFGAFTCVAGENAAGKSNLFDAIEFLALLSDHTLMDAARLLRSTSDRRSGDPRDLFWQRKTDVPVTLAAEMIVPPTVVDDFGQSGQASITFLRYEVEIGLEAPTLGQRQSRLVLLREELRHINLGSANQHLRFPHAVAAWRDKVVIGRRSGTAFISTEPLGDDTVVKIHQDGGSRGKPNIALPGHAPRTVISTITQITDPTILAARREMQSWRRLALEPAAMRASDSYSDSQTVEPNGAHLASALYRVAASSASSEDVYARITSRLASLTGLRLRSVEVQPDDTRESLTVVLTEPDGTEIPARSLSEGTLRFLALCVLYEDPSVTGLLCMEEPENGIHPANLPAMLRIIEDLAMDPHEPPGDDNPFRQVIINTHSPYVVQLVAPSDLLIADTVRLPGAPRVSAAMLRLRPYVDSWRAKGQEKAFVGTSDLFDYLVTPANAQLRFDIRDSAGAA